MTQQECFDTALECYRRSQLGHEPSKRLALAELARIFCNMANSQADRRSQREHAQAWHSFLCSDKPLPQDAKSLMPEHVTTRLFDSQVHGFLPSGAVGLQ